MSPKHFHHGLQGLRGAPTDLDASVKGLDACRDPESCYGKVAERLG